MEDTKATTQAIPKTDKPAPAATTAKKYRYIGPAGAERVVIPGTVVSITLATLSEAEIEGKLKQYPGMARLYQLA
jgi:hypothetical protein